MIYGVSGMFPLAENNILYVIGYILSEVVNFFSLS